MLSSKEELSEDAEELVTEEENERAGVEAGVLPLFWLNFRDLASASARAVRYACAERPLSVEVDDFLRPKTGDCMGEGMAVVDE